jgi:hypothetical protein
VNAKAVDGLFEVYENPVNPLGTRKEASNAMLAYPHHLSLHTVTRFVDSLLVEFDGHMAEVKLARSEFLTGIVVCHCPLEGNSQFQSFNRSSPQTDARK